MTPTGSPFRRPLTPAEHQRVKEMQAMPREQFRALQQNLRVAAEAALRQRVAGPQIQIFNIGTAYFTNQGLVVPQPQPQHEPHDKPKPNREELKRDLEEQMRRIREKTGKLPKPEPEKRVDIAPEGSVLSRFNFNTINPEMDCMLYDSKSFHEITKTALATLRSKAAKAIKEKIDTSVELRDIVTDDDLKPLWIALKSCNFFEGDFNSDPGDLDLHTANALVFQKALEKGLIIPHPVQKNRLEIKPTSVFIYYLTEPSPGSSDQWQIVPTIIKKGDPFRLVSPHY